MGSNIAIFLKKLKVKGFVGPAYEGLLGKFRFAWEEFAIRTDIVLVATQSTFVAQHSSGDIPIEIRFIENTNELKTLCPKFDGAYYPGFTSNWDRSIKTGEVLIVGIVEGEPVAFVWMQKGKVEGVVCYYGVFLQGDARLYRAGVMPGSRGRGIYTRFMHALLCKVFEPGDIQRVYIDCHKANIAAYKAHLKSGFRELGGVTVIRGLGNRRFIRWQ